MEEALETADAVGLIPLVVADCRVYAFFTDRRSYREPIDVKVGDLPSDGASTTRVTTPEAVQRDELVRVWPPTSALPAIRGRYSEEAIWEETNAAWSDNLFTHIQGVVTGQNPDFLRRYRLGDRALRLLSRADLYEKETPADQHASHELILRLPKRAAERLVAAGVTTDTVTDGEGGHDLRIRVERGELFHFRTGVVVTTMALEVLALEKGRQLSAP